MPCIFFFINGLTTSASCSTFRLVKAITKNKRKTIDLFTFWLQEPEIDSEALIYGVTLKKGMAGRLKLSMGF